MDKKRSFLNISTSICSRIILLFAALYVRRILILYIGNDVNGLNSLYSSIIGMLAVAELGIGSAIVFSMYKPIVHGDNRKTAALYGLYMKLYRIVGGIIFLAGLCIMPFLPDMIGDYESLNVNVYFSFLLTLISVVLSYLYGAKTSLIIAYKDDYIVTCIITFASLIRYGLQICTIFLFESYILFLICQIIETLIVWLLTDIAVAKKHSDIVRRHEKVDETTKLDIIRNVKAMMMHKIGSLLVNTIDSLVISSFIGVVILGKYSNYTLVLGVLVSIISLCFTPLTSIIGHLCASGDVKKIKRYFDRFFYINYLLGIIFFLGYYATIDNIITICFGTGLLMSRSISFILTLNQFTLYMRNASLLFRNASGTFYYDRWKPLIEGVINLFLSLLFVNIFPNEYRVVGVIVATIITTLLICDVVEPYVIFKNVFGSSPKKFFIRSYAYIGLFFLCQIVLTYLMKSYNNQFITFIINGFISVCVSIFVILLLVMMDKAFRWETKQCIVSMIRWLGILR